MDTEDILRIEFETMFYQDAVEVLPACKNNPDIPLNDSPIVKTKWVSPDQPIESEQEQEESIRIELKTGGIIDFSAM